MKILISAYSCEPNSGSEHEVGWSWIKALSKNNKNKITVITRKSNKKKFIWKILFVKKKMLIFGFMIFQIFF